MSVEAGPVERSVLYLQESHISNVIQFDNLDHTLRVRRSDNLIWDLWKSGVLHRRVRSCLNEMGFYVVFQIWAWSRMTPLCPDRLGYNLIAPHENPNYSDNVLPIPPYGARWKHAYCWTHTPTHSVRIIRDVLDRMGDSQFNWVIYDLGAPDISSLPIECRNPMLWRSVCPLICFHIVEWHRPNRVLRQFAMLQHIPGPALDGDKLHEVSRRGRPNFDWANHHRVFVDAWADRHNLVVETEYAVNFCMTDEYARWYDLITRRFVSPIDPVQVDSGYQPGDAYFRRVVRDGTSTIANICKGVAIEDLSREDLVEALTKLIATAAFLHELTLKTPQQQQHQARSSTRRRQGRGDNRRRGDDLQSFDTSDWRQSTSQTPLTSDSHQTSSGADVGPTFRDVGPSYVFSSPLSSSFFDFSQGSGGNDQEDQRTAHQQSDFLTPPAYTTYQDSFMEGIFGGISHQYGGEHPTFDTSPVTYIGYSLPNSTAASASQVPPEYVEEREDEDDYQAPNIIRRSRRVPRAPDCGTGHRLGHRFGRG
ncbi:serine/threonine-protein phosphatase 7 long form [Dorcoceras hygrometricum]|uniref:Serine/threonine-protein phosphatase 7 long form n=1 Tax=Dorcoceras hygrometricum TaxID=472368 RepID=A0A2Z7CVP0_9LAMI|nr:serine/threonine-protein phosphatase 7 long form [Dorcoceras hygrometricum]